MDISSPQSGDTSSVYFCSLTLFLVETKRMGTVEEELNRLTAGLFKRGPTAPGQ